MPYLERLIKLDHLQISWAPARTGPWRDSKSLGSWCHYCERLATDVEISRFAEIAELEKGKLIVVKAKMKRMLISSQIN